MSMDIAPVEKWSEILDDYEVVIHKKDYEICFIMMDRNAESPVYDVHSEDVEFVIVGDSKEELQETIAKTIPTALQSTNTFVLATNWAFIRTKYKALNYNGKRITLAHTDDGASPISATSIFSKTLVPTVGQWFTAVHESKGTTYGLLSRTVDGKDFALVTDEPDEMLSMLIKSDNEEIAVKTMSDPKVTLSSVNLTKITNACDGIYYRTGLYLTDDIIDEAERCLQKFRPQEEATIGLLKSIRLFNKNRETEGK